MAKQLKPFNDYIFKESEIPIIQRTEENFLIIDWKNKFTHRLFEVDKLQSIILEKEDDFHFLKQLIKGYNDDLLDKIEKGFKTVRNGGWRRNFVDEIFKITLQIIYTYDRGKYKLFL